MSGAGHRHAQRHLFARRAALRAADRHARRWSGTGCARRLHRRSCGGSARRSRRSRARGWRRLGEIGGDRGLRGTEPARLARMVRGDLDWIVMKALEKDRTRRYETAGGMARDIQRHWRASPVEAGPAVDGLPAAEAGPQASRWRSRRRRRSRPCWWRPPRSAPGRPSAPGGRGAARRDRDAAIYAQQAEAEARLDEAAEEESRIEAEKARGDQSVPHRGSAVPGGARS